MHSFRALARAAPRATARLTASSARASIRPAFTNSIRTQAPRAITAAFSTSRPTFDASSQELAAKLTSELSIESENAESTASDSNVQNFLGRTDWQLHDVDGEQIVKLSRKFEDELIEVRFTIADFNNPYPEHEDARAVVLTPRAPSTRATTAATATSRSHLRTALRLLTVRVSGTRR
jgi:complement component 1 Q subcomponent-binding protein